MAEQDSSSSKKWKRSLIEWGILFTVVGLLYISGLHTQVIGTLQRGILATGLIKPDIPEEVDDAESANLDFYFSDTDGSVHSLKDFEGDVIFLNIWATWCPPCIAEMPSIHSLYQDFRNDDDISFILVSVDEKFSTANTFMENREYDLPIYHYRSKQPGTYNSTAIPTTYIISPDSKIVLENQGYAKYDTDEFREFIELLKKGT